MRARSLGSALIISAMCGCSPERASVRVGETRVVAKAEATHVAMGTAERMGLSGPASAKPNTGGSSSGGFAWITPAGWSELPVSSMRVANFRVAGDTRAECYLTLLGGDGGGLKANIDRWRTQMGLAALSVEDVAALPRGEFLGGEAVFVDFEGTFTGMGAGGVLKSARLVGLLRIEPGGSAFLKMTGPADLIAGEVDAFVRLARSFRSGGPVESRPDEERSILEWKVPQGWRTGTERSTRVVTLHHGADDEIECYVTTLPSEAGGELANVNRWRGQLGARPWSAAELAAAPRVKLLGRQVALAEAEGVLRRDPRPPQQDALLLGAALCLPSGSVFVKLTGPKARVEHLREDLAAFCASLAEAR